MNETKENKATVSLWVKLQTVFSGLILVLLVALTLWVTTQAQTLHHTLEVIEQEVEELQMDEVNNAVAALTRAANQLAAVDVDTLNQTAASLKAAADSLGKLDIDEINDTVTALTAAANNLGEMDIEQLNDLITSLNNVATKLSSISEGLSHPFGLGG